MTQQDVICHQTTCTMTGEGVTWGHAIPHFRYFSALVPQIRTQKLTITCGVHYRVSQKKVPTFENP